MSISSRKRQSKAVTLGYLAIATLLLIVIAAVALVIVPPSPPSVAEFAPQAVEQIDDAPNQQSSRFGAGGNGTCAAGQVCEEAELPIGSSKKVIDKARVRRCVGDPPRQTEDPQSPPCINFWEGDNGGATWRGVTRDEVRVAFFNFSADPSIYEKIGTYFNRRYEFYGRRLRLIQVDPQYATSGTPQGKRALAQKVADEHQAFAAVGWYRGEKADYFRELARRGVVGINETADYETSTDQQETAPYLWTYRPPLDQVLKNVAEFSCKSLVGKPAAYANGPQAATERYFAIGVDGDGSNPDYRPLEDGLKRCGARVRIVTLPDGGFSVGGQNSTYGPIALDLQFSGITTIFCVCEEYDWYNLCWESRNVGYQPEWVSTGMPEVSDWHKGPGAGCNQQWFGLGSEPKDIRLADRPGYLALREVDPEARPSSSTSISLDIFYQGMLTLASGVQAAGPRLTPQSFERGLFDSKFPNPGSAGPPYWQPGGDFSAGDHAFVDDFNLFWYAYESRQETKTGSSDTPGGLCYINRGARWARGMWPSGDLPFFDRTQPCR